MKRAVVAFIVLVLPLVAAHAYSVTSSWSYDDANSSGEWEPGENQWWDYTVTYDAGETLYYFGVYIGSRVTEDMISSVEILDGGSPYSGSWEYSIDEQTTENESTRILWHSLEYWGFGSGLTFRFYDNVEDDTTLLNRVGPHDDDVAWGTGVDTDTTTAIWTQNPDNYSPEFQQTGDQIAVTPEPGSVALLALGLVGLAGIRRRR